MYVLLLSCSVTVLLLVLLWLKLVMSIWLCSLVVFTICSRTQCLWYSTVEVCKGGGHHKCSCPVFLSIYCCSTVGLWGFKSLLPVSGGSVGLWDCRTVGLQVSQSVGDLWDCGTSSLPVSEGSVGLWDFESPSQWGICGTVGLQVFTQAQFLLSPLWQCIWFIALF